MFVFKKNLFSLVLLFFTLSSSYITSVLSVCIFSSAKPDQGILYSFSSSKATLHFIYFHFWHYHKARPRKLHTHSLSSSYCTLHFYFTCLHVPSYYNTRQGSISFLIHDDVDKGRDSKLVVQCYYWSRAHIHNVKGKHNKMMANTLWSTPLDSEKGVTVLQAFLRTIWRPPLQSVPTHRQRPTRGTSQCWLFWRDQQWLHL